jgi:hypothetical protein
MTGGKTMLPHLPPRFLLRNYQKIFLKQPVRNAEPFRSDISNQSFDRCSSVSSEKMRLLLSQCKEFGVLDWFFSHFWNDLRMEDSGKLVALENAGICSLTSEVL